MRPAMIVEVEAEYNYSMTCDSSFYLFDRPSGFEQSSSSVSSYGESANTNQLIYYSPRTNYSVCILLCDLRLRWRDRL